VTAQVLVDEEIVAEMETDDEAYAEEWMAEHAAKAEGRGTVTTNLIPG
jgi:hypothetical protein